MKHLQILLLSLLFWLPFDSISQNDVLIIDYANNFSSDQTNNNSRIYNRLVATQTSVTRINAIPATISNTYDEVWIFGNMGVTTAAILNPVVNYINAGGAVYVQSEVSCCNNEAAFADNIINAVSTLGPSITHNITTGMYYQYQTHPTIDCPNSAWDPSYGAAIRPFYGTPANNVLFEAVTGCASSVVPGDVIGVQIGACDMISGQGAFISNGDFNIFPYSGACGIGIMGTSNREHVIDLIANLFDSLLLCAPFCSNVLPIELLHFDGYASGNNNELYWATSAEINNDYFTLERSSDGFEYYPIGQVPGAGNSSVLLNYQFTDYSPPYGTNYYRLKQTDYNGDFTYSNIIAIESDQSSLRIFPNPFNTVLTVAFDEAQSGGELKIYSVTGQLVHAEPFKANLHSMQFDLSNLSAGSYFVQVNSGDFSWNERIVKW